MAYLSDSDWRLVVKAVENAGGIRQTGGTAGRLIRDYTLSQEKRDFDFDWFN